MTIYANAIDSFYEWRYVPWVLGPGRIPGSVVEGARDESKA
jgi:hypothetical protein